MKRASLSAAIYLLVTFISGTASGVFGYWLYNSRTVRADSATRSESYRKRYLDEMNTRLKLSKEQSQKLATILDGTRQLYRELSDKHRPEFQVIHQHQIEQVQSILDERQRSEYAKILKEQEERRKSRPHPGGF